MAELLSVLIPARNEMFLGKTVENILANIEGDTEVIAVCDGYRPDPPLIEHPRLRVIYHEQSIGQRAAANEAARASSAQYVMKCDAHCAFDKGFDVKLCADFEPDWTVIPRMYNLHGFDWQCKVCGDRTYQGPKPTKCAKCHKGTEFEMVIVWQPRMSRRTDFARFDSDLHFQYWKDYERRPESAGDISEVMSSVGACWMMPRDRFWQLGGMDEAHGSWGQMGTEVACKSWLSGGKQMVNKKTWFSHMFRTQPGFGFPYPNPGVRARTYSQDLWRNGKWPKAVHPLMWLVEKFWPVPGWPENTFNKTASVNIVIPAKVVSPSKGIVYYTDNRCDPVILQAAQNQMKRSVNGHKIVSVSLQPIEFGQNCVLDLERGILTMFRQILAGLERSESEIIFLCEHDVLYHPSHFDFIPARRDRFYYNENTWKVDAKTGQALFYYCKQTSGLCAYRDLLIEHYRKRIERVSAEGYNRRMGFEPGTHRPPNGVDFYKAESWMSPFPNVDIRHRNNLTPSRWDQSQFRNSKSCLGWQMADEVPGWGKTKGRFDKFIMGVSNG